MAGSYPDPIGARIEYDKDGSGVVWWDGTSAATIAQGTVNALNNENDVGGQGTSTFPGGRFVGILFPVPHTITGYYMYNDGGWNLQIETSTDTTTAVDGTWSVAKASFTNPNPTPIYYRTNAFLPAAPIPNCTGIRFKILNGNSGSTITTCQVYGYRTAATGNWLTLWHASLDQPLHQTPAVLDMGNKARGSGYATLGFRVKNVSSTLTANTISLTRDALTDGSPTVVSLTDLNYNGGAFGTTAAVGNLGPGAVSELCIARINVSATAPIGLWAPRVTATALTWS